MDELGTRQYSLACLICGTGLVSEEARARCGFCGAAYFRLGGIWRFLPESRATAFAGFLHEYRTVRKAEGWGAKNERDYRAFPGAARNDPLNHIWRIRSRSFQTLFDQVLRPLEARRPQPLKVFDVGAGNGWLSYQLSQRGHEVAAIDISTDDSDGLGTMIRYGHATAVAIQAEFDRLPFLANQADLVVFNASLHYSTNYHSTLSEALRVLRADGLLTVLDSPVYRDTASGDLMVREREAAFQRTYGFAATAIQTEGFLTYGRLGALARTLHLQLRIIDPVPGWRSTLRAVKNRLRGRRESAAFPIIVLQRELPSATNKSPL
jgi:SAM-dependent methyltransferase